MLPCSQATCPVIAAPATLSAWEMTLVMLPSLLPIPVTADATTPYALMNELTNNIEKDIAALCKHMGSPNFTRRLKILLSIRKLEALSQIQTLLCVYTRRL